MCKLALLVIILVLFGFWQILTIEQIDSFRTIDPINVLGVY